MLGHPRGPVYGADGLSCAVRSQYREIQFFLHLLPVRQQFPLQGYILMESFC